MATFRVCTVAIDEVDQNLSADCVAHIGNQLTITCDGVSMGIGTLYFYFLLENSSCRPFSVEVSFELMKTKKQSGKTRKEVARQRLNNVYAQKQSNGSNNRETV